MIYLILSLVLSAQLNQSLAYADEEEHEPDGPTDLLPIEERLPFCLKFVETYKTSEDVYTMWQCQLILFDSVSQKKQTIEKIQPILTELQTKQTDLCESRFQNLKSIKDPYLLDNCLNFYGHNGASFNLERSREFPIYERLIQLRPSSVKEHVTLAWYYWSKAKDTGSKAALDNAIRVWRLLLLNVKLDDHRSLRKFFIEVTVPAIGYYNELISLALEIHEKYEKSAKTREEKIRCIMDKAHFYRKLGWNSYTICEFRAVLELDPDNRAAKIELEKLSD